MFSKVGVSMKRVTCILTAVMFVFFFLGQTSAQTQSQTQPADQTASVPPVDTTKSFSEQVGWMIGEWEGEGVSGQVQFVGKLSVTSELDGEALLLSRESMNKGGNVSGGLKEITVIGVDGTTKKIVATIYDNKNTIALYVGELKPNELVFTATSMKTGYAERRSFKQLADGGLSFVVERSSPGKEMSKVTEINFKKKM